MGGSGGGSFPSSKYLRSKFAEKREADQQKLTSDINQFLQDVLAGFNQRDAKRTQRQLEQLRSILGEQVPVIQFLFGGSVAKHTYVDGLSDIDALVILDREELVGTTPRSVLRDFHKQLQDNLTADIVRSVELGRLAVTVHYRDGSEIQLLPAIRTRTAVAIPTSQGKRWNETNPKAFQRILGRTNDRLNGTLIPAIKLFKSINSGLPKVKQLSGYHIESLCIDAVKGYRGPKTVKALLQHTLETASKLVLKPISDVTKQSRIIDDYLGEANSTQRRIAADALASVARKLGSATSVDIWRETVDK
jgi:predicted nucleotidyltransferase